MKKLLVVFGPLLMMTNPGSVAAAEATVSPQVRQIRNVSKINAYTVSTLNIIPGGWTSSARFRISRLEGLQKTYFPEEQIIFYIEGESENLHIEEDNGFKAAATLLDLSNKSGNPAERIGERIDAEWDSGSRTWKVELAAPVDISDKYAIVVHLYCGQRLSSCADEFGYGTQDNETVFLEVR